MFSQPIRPYTNCVSQHVDDVMTQTKRWVLSVLQQNYLLLIVGALVIIKNPDYFRHLKLHCAIIC